MEEQTTTTKETAVKSADAVQIQTARFGEVEVARDRIIRFPRGLVGLPEAQQFVFLHPEEAEGPFFWMQSVEDPALAFVVCDPRSFFPEYEVPLSVDEQETLEIHKPEDGVVCVILVVPEDPRNITANLRGPVIVNTMTSVGLQLVLADEFPVRAQLFNAAPEGGAGCSS